MSDSRVTAFSLSLSLVCECARTYASTLWAAQIHFIVLHMFLCAAYLQWHHHTCSRDSLVSTATVPMIPLTCASLCCLSPPDTHASYLTAMLSMTYARMTGLFCNQTVFGTHWTKKKRMCLYMKLTCLSVWCWAPVWRKPTSPVWGWRLFLLWTLSNRQTHTSTAAAESRDGSDIYRQMKSSLIFTGSEQDTCCWYILIMH